ncbi:MAG: 5-methyltetrahydropteroyltriglutamate--homocysteine S-methyltransferase [Sneathiellaceae bacterium]
MTHPQNPPFRAEHIGSLLRPRALVDAFKARRTSGLEAALFKAILEESIADAVRLQEDAGLQVVTDGEFRRVSYWSHFVDAVDGLTVADSLFVFRDDDGHEHGFTAPLAEARIARNRPISGDEFDHLTGVASRLPKITMPSPPTMHFWRGRQTIAPGVYDDEEAYFADLARVFNAEILDLAARGCRYVQIDEVPLAMLCDPAVRETLAARGEDPQRLAARYVRLINECIRERPAGLTIGLHLCRGNHKGKWLSSGGYESVAELLFNETEVDAFFLEYDSERAGGFEPLRRLPATKVAVLGLVTTKSPALESEDDLARRIDSAAQFAPLDNLAVSPQCGFSSTIGGNPVTIDDERRKLELVVQVAHRVWGSA